MAFARREETYVLAISTSERSESVRTINRRSAWLGGTALAAAAAMTLAAFGFVGPAQAQQPAKPNIIMIISDDTGYGDLGPYGGGVGRGMPTPNIDRIAAEGMTFFSFYAQPSCTPAAPRCRPGVSRTAAA